MARLPLVVGLSLGLLLAFVPLFDVLGYESAAAAGLALGLLALLRAATEADGGVVLGGPLDPVGRYVRGLPASLLPVGLAAAVLLLNAFRVRNCDIPIGLWFWLLIPVVAVLLCRALGLFAAALAGRGHRRWLLALLLVVLEIGALLHHLAWDPPIAGYSWTFGWFAGSIYDEALAIPTGLLWFRLGNLLLAATLVLVLQVGWMMRRGRAVLRPLAALGVLAAAQAGLRLEHNRLGIDVDRAYVISELSGVRQSARLVVHFDPSALDAAQADLLLEDLEYRYHELRTWFGVDVVAVVGRPIHVFAYPSGDTQHRLMGARGTQVARPWTHEMHIRWDGFGDAAAAHELAHLFTAPFGAGPLRLGTRGSWTPDMGLTEGIAVAADWRPSDLDDHLASAGMRRLDLAPDLRATFLPTGFWTAPGGKAYTLMGSFVRWLVDTRGMPAFQQVYGSGDWEAAYGADIDTLIGQWEVWLDATELSEDDLALTSQRYRRKSIFQKTCARTLAELERRAGRASGRGELDAARKLRERLITLQPGKAGPVVELAELLVAAKDYAGARAVVTALDQAKLGPADQLQVVELLADLDWRAGDADAALDGYRQCKAGGDAALRRLQVKEAGAAQVGPAGPLAQRYLLDNEGRALSLYVAQRWALVAPDDPLPAYLVGFQLHGAREWADAAPWLARSAFLPSPQLEDQRLILLAESLYHLGWLDEAQAVWQEAAERPGRRIRGAAEEGLARVRWKRTWAPEPAQAE